MPILVDGDLLSDDEVRKLIKLVNDVAYEMAGQFHGCKRSRKFRKQWPNEYDFAEQNWKNFIEGARAFLADTLRKYQSGIIKGKPTEADSIHKALILQAMIGEASQNQTPIQVSTGTQAFDGDSAENRKTDENFGTHPMLKHLH